MRWRWWWLSVVAALPAAAALAESQPYEMYFPLVGGGVPTDDFGDPRGDHTHEGNDILAPKMTEVVAVSTGTVGWVSDECCAFELLHDDGWSSWYIHLNNDSPDTDDGLGWGMVDGIVPGATIEAGQLVGWVGDSGNAEDAEPHLHFELHRPNGEAIDPQKHLLAATVLDEPIGGSPEEGAARPPPLRWSSSTSPARSTPMPSAGWRRRGSRRAAPPTEPASVRATR